MIIISGFTDTDGIQHIHKDSHQKGFQPKITTTRNLNQMKNITDLNTENMHLMVNMKH